MTVQIHGQELTLSGTVGADWFDDGFTHAELVAVLADLSGDITVRLNSGGGYAAEGAAMHATLTTYPGKVNLVVEGIAASAASLIAMAGDTITMSDGAVMMIHDPMNLTFGNSDEHAKMIEQLEAYAKAYARVYASRTGKSADECREIMKAETWYDGEGAVAAGFADATGTAKAKAVAAYDYRVYASAPKALAVMARAKNWSIDDHLPTTAVSSAAQSHKEIDPMNDKERADALAAELATMKATAAAAEAAAKTASETAVADALKADRERRTAIMALPETKGREALAEVMFADGMTVDKAKAYLAAAPAATEAKAEEDDGDDYESRRLAGAAVNAAGKGDKSGKTDAKASWAKVVARYNKNNK